MGSIAIAGSGSGGLTVGTTTITGGTNKDLLFDNAGVLGEETLSAAIDVIGSAQGDILYRDAAVWKVLAPGTNGFVLQSGGAGANPSWVSGPAATLTVGVTTISGGVAGGILWDSGPGILEESSKWTFNGTETVSLNGGTAMINLPASFNFFDGGAGNTTLTGQGNFGTGNGALAALTTGFRNSCVGDGAMTLATADGACVAIGFNALSNLNNTTTGNIALGQAALGSFTSGNNNLAIGTNALLGTLGSSTGSGNVAVGSSSLQHCTTGHDNLAVGSNSLNANTTGASNMAIGASALAANLTGGTNVAIGSQALQTATADSNNVAIGALALATSNGGGSNTVVGQNAGSNVTIGGSNVLIGNAAGFSVTSGSQNVILAFFENTITSGSNNIAIGNQVGNASATASNQLVIGNYIYGTGLSGTNAAISPGKIGLGVKAPAFALDVNGGIQANDVTALIHAATAMNNGAGTGSGVTFTNAPGASGATGNPTKWVPFDDAGTTRYIPMF